MSWWGFWGPPARAGATVRPVTSPTAFVFCYVLWVAGRISALLRRGDLGPEWRGQLSGVTQLRSGKAHTHCSFQDHDDVERPMGWRCGRWEVAPTVVLTVWKWTESGVFCSRKCPQHVSASGLAYVSCWAPPAGQGAGAPRVLPPPGTPLAPDGPSPGKVPRAARTPGEVAGWVQSRVLHRAARAGTAGRALALPAPPAHSPPPDLPTPQASSVPSVTQGQESGFLPGERAPPPAQTRSRATEWAAE